ncbi:MAG: hypothetical protein ACK5JT_10305 [Hyphomicrobiaceae bacterium]
MTKNGSNALDKSVLLAIVVGGAVFAWLATAAMSDTYLMDTGTILFLVALLLALPLILLIPDREPVSIYARTEPLQNATIIYTDRFSRVAGYVVPIEHYPHGHYHAAPYYHPVHLPSRDARITSLDDCPYCGAPPWAQVITRTPRIVPHTRHPRIRQYARRSNVVHLSPSGWRRPARIRGYAH